MADLLLCQTCGRAHAPGGAHVKPYVLTYSCPACSTRNDSVEIHVREPEAAAGLEEGRYVVCPACGKEATERLARILGSTLHALRDGERLVDENVLAFTCAACGRRNPSSRIVREIEFALPDGGRESHKVSPYVVCSSCSSSFAVPADLLHEDEIREEVGRRLEGRACARCRRFEANGNEKRCVGCGAFFDPPTESAVLQEADVRRLVEELAQHEERRTTWPLDPDLDPEEAARLLEQHGSALRVEGGGGRCVLVTLPHPVPQEVAANIRRNVEDALQTGRPLLLDPGIRLEVFPPREPSPPSSPSRIGDRVPALLLLGAGAVLLTLGAAIGAALVRGGN